MTRQEEFRRRAAAALANPRIRENLGRFGTAYRTARRNALAVLDYEKERARLRRMKEDAIERLPELAREFVEAARRVGAIVYEAKNAEEANRYIGDLARAKGVELVVKSKSMVSEEIELNHYLERLGITPVEADLGEWIIQQAGAHPSHSVMPCIHMSKEEVAGVFSKALGRQIPPDVSLMVRLAREELREKFLSAGMGISGANIAVAETGSVIIVTNTSSCLPRQPPPSISRSTRPSSLGRPGRLQSAGLGSSEAPPPVRCTSFCSITAAGRCGMMQSSGRPCTVSVVPPAPTSVRRTGSWAGMCSAISTPG
jgi:L-lactate utilization protein LutB